jgi:ABC-type glycerol-3-phosphate transport system substrate-binding protein
VLALHSLENTPNLIDFIADPIIGLDGDQQKSISSKDWESVSYNGNVAGIPAQKEAYFLLYNSSWAKTLGFNHPPETIDDYSTQLQTAFEANLTLQDKNQRGTGGWIINWLPEIALNWMGTAFEFDGMEKDFSQDIVLDTFTELKEHQNTGFFWIAKNSDPIPYFVDRLALMISASSSELPEMIIHMEKMQMQDEWIIIPYPRINPNAGSIHSLSSFGLCGDEFDKQLAGWLFIQWMMEPEHQAYISVNQYTIPADQNAAEQLKDFASNTSIADSLIQLSVDSGTVPGFPEWIYAKPVLSDGFRQLFPPETTPDMIPAIIEQMDVMYAEFRE